MSREVSPPLDRRGFLKLSALAGGGLMLAHYLRAAGSARDEIAKPTQERERGGFTPSVFLSIAPDGEVTIFSARPEVGQGIRTSLPMVVAEELGADWRRVKVVPAPLNPAYGQQVAGGSTSTPNSYLPMRRVGAAARTMLIGAAAGGWGVPPGECRAEGGFVHHGASGRSADFGSLAAAAAQLPVPDEKGLVLKDPADFKLLGTRVGGVDNPAIVTGKPLFGIDLVLPEMLYAVYERCPVWGGRVRKANLEHVKSLPGVREAFVVNEASAKVTGLVPGVAIVARSTWEAIRARKQLQVSWEEEPFAESSWEKFAAEAKALFDRGPMEEIRRDGDLDRAFSGAAKVVQADYAHAFISHANLEPQNCTARVQGDRAEFWAPTQNPADGQAAVAAYLGIPPAQLTVHITRIGGGFGRRLHSDFMLEAAAIARRVAAPVKLTWTREDDLRHDHFRPGGFHRLRGAVDAAGRLSAWSGQQAYFDQGLGADTFPGRFVPAYLLRTAKLDNGIPMGPWRAPGSCTHAFVAGSFLDELAHAAGRDPVAFALELFDSRAVVPGTGPKGVPYDAPRMRGVIALAAEKSGWGRPLPRGRGMGLGFYFCHQGYVAEVAEVTVSRGGDLAVERVVAAVDVGSQIVNLSGAEAQVQGAVIDGLSAAWRQELDIQRGRVPQSNFHEYALLRLPAAPKAIDIHFLKTDHPPTGLGEPALPPLAPAVANAVFAATGIRIRQLPFSRTSLAWL